jgi:hypothetical protein
MDDAFPTYDSIQEGAISLKMHINSSKLFYDKVNASLTRIINKVENSDHAVSDRSFHSVFQ